MSATCTAARRRSVGAALLLAVLTLAAPLRAEAVAASWSQVVSGDSATCAIRSDQTLWCWGANSSGQIGDGTTVDRNAPARVAGDGRWTAVARGSGHTCGIRTDGSLWCWGANTEHQLGLDSDTPFRSSPVRVGTATDWTSVHSRGTSRARSAPITACGAGAAEPAAW
ncbi:hypothetical protein AB0G04_33805 [Actinoplanes sp. NPDC023801]|uniref:RCC1 domain-containing protein n=1 Tax=Actinoplanes sp. NPDC023801 TaxID=3154595 RepID=UPI0033F3FDA8